MLGTGLVVDKTISSKNWEKGLIDTFDSILSRRPIKRFIQVPHCRFHSNSSFFMLVIDLPKNVRQIIIFYNSPVMTTKTYKDNKIIKHLRKLNKNANSL